MNNNPDNRIVLNPSSIPLNIPSQHAVTNSNDGTCNTDTLIDFESDVVSTSVLQSSDQNPAAIHDRQLHQFIRPSFNESSGFYSSTQTAVLSSEYETYPNFRYSPPPPYDLYPSPSQSRSSPYPQQISHFPQHQNVQYLQQQRLQHPQQESLQYHEEMLDYPQRMSYAHRRDGNFREQPPVFERRRSCDRCMIIDTMCCCFCVLPICVLLWLLFVTPTDGY